LSSLRNKDGVDLGRRRSQQSLRRQNNLMGSTGAAACLPRGTWTVLQAGDMVENLDISHRRPCPWNSFFNLGNSTSAFCLVGSGGGGALTLSCVDDGAGHCVIRADLSVCGASYHLVGFDLTADSSAPKRLTRDVANGCCRSPNESEIA